MNPEELQGRPDDAIQAAADRRHLKPAAMLSHAETRIVHIECTRR
jgi:hypothetical protein